MPFKINIAHKGKTYKVESDDEILIGKKIGEQMPGSELQPALHGYTLIISGTSDIAGIAGMKGLDGLGYHRRLLTYGKGMKDRRGGMRLRKTLRGEEISPKTIQINMIVAKEGDTKFSELVKKEEKKE